MENIGKLEKLIKGKLLRNEPMSKHTSFGIGGPVRAFLYPADEDDLVKILKFANQYLIPVYFVGSGTNLLVSDDGFNGFVISIQKTFKTVRIEGTRVFAETGVMLGHLVKECMKHHLTGVESLIGVPGTLGGAIKMNAGAYGEEISKYLLQITVITKKGKQKRYQKDEIEFGYRYSSIPDHELILSAEFRFKEGTPEEIEVNQMRASRRRKMSQPLRYRSAGSIFKNPSQGEAAGYLIDQAGLKGMRQGDAEISTMHANFFINRGKATAKDMANLIRITRETVKNKFDVNLQLEIKTLGFPPHYFEA